jgi:hypothetical protein
MKNLSKLFDELATKIEHFEKINLAVSSATVGWHIAHTTLAAKKIIEQLEKSDPANYKWKFNSPRFFVFLMKKIPRGKAKAPKSVQIEEGFTIDSLNMYIDFIKTKVKILDTMDSKNNFLHPYFGMLNLKATIKTLLIHTNHHIKIINDIIKKVS